VLAALGSDFGENIMIIVRVGNLLKLWSLVFRTVIYGSLQFPMIFATASDNSSEEN
jgi:hypothetical protein